MTTNSNASTTALPPSCPQDPQSYSVGGEQDEDCLFATAYIPRTAGPASRLPIFTWWVMRKRRSCIVAVEADPVQATWRVFRAGFGRGTGTERCTTRRAGQHDCRGSSIQVCSILSALVVSLPP